MARVARSLSDVILGEAVSGTPEQRFADMVAIASTIANRAAATGVSMEDVISAPGQYTAYGRALPPGVEKFRSLAQKAIEHVRTKGPVTTAQFYATPAAVDNLPSGLMPVGKTKGHQFFEDPQARAIRTAVGYRKPGVTAYDIVPEDDDDVSVATPDSVLDAIFGLGTATSAAASRTPKDDELDSIFGLEPSTTAPTAKSQELDAVFGATPVSAPAAFGSIDDPSAEWDGSFTNPLGAITDRETSGFGFRSAPSTSLGVGSVNHAGIDLSAEPGQQGYAAEAAAPGVVTYAGPAKGYGNLVTVEHPNGFTSRYGHLADINVSVGDEIARGMPVGTVGATGNVSGAHLHFEVRDQIGNPVDPRSVVDMSMRDTISPTSRPMSPTEQRNTASAYGNMAAFMGDAGVLGVGRTAPASSGLLAGFDVSRFAGDVDPARFGGFSYAGPSAPASQAAGYARAETGMPSSERFGRTAAIDPARFGGAQPTPSASVTSPYSPAGSYAAAEAPGGFSEPSAARFGGQMASVEPSPERFGRTASAPSFGSPSAPFSPAGSYASVTAPSIDPSAPSPVRPDNLNFQGPKGTFSVKTPVASIGDLNAQPVTQGWAGTLLGLRATSAATSVVPSIEAMSYLPNTVTAAPKALAPMLTPKVTPMVTPVARTPQQSLRSVPAPTPRPSFSAFDVYSGKAPVGYQSPATGGNLVSRDQFGNTTVTNRYGASTTTDPSGRQMAVWSGLDDIDIGKPTPGMIGAVVGGVVGGIPGAVAGYTLGNRAAGQKASQKAGGLGGLGGLLSGIFGGGNSGGGNGASGSRSSGGGRGSSGPAGRDRDHAGN